MSGPRGTQRWRASCGRSRRPVVQRRTRPAIRGSRDWVTVPTATRCAAIGARASTSSRLAGPCCGSRRTHSRSKVTSSPPAPISSSNGVPRPTRSCDCGRRESSTIFITEWTLSARQRPDRTTGPPMFSLRNAFRGKTSACWVGSASRLGESSVMSMCPSASRSTALRAIRRCMSSYSFPPSVSTKST